MVGGIVNHPAVIHGLMIHHEAQTDGGGVGLVTGGGIGHGNIGRTVKGPPRYWISLRGRVLRNAVSTFPNRPKFIEYELYGG